MFFYYLILNYFSSKHYIVLNEPYSVLNMESIREGRRIDYLAMFGISKAEANIES